MDFMLCVQGHCHVETGLSSSVPNAIAYRDNLDNRMLVATVSCIWGLMVRSEYLQTLGQCSVKLTNIIVEYCEQGQTRGMTA